MENRFGLKDLILYVLVKQLDDARKAAKAPPVQPPPVAAPVVPNGPGDADGVDVAPVAVPART